MSIVTRMFTEEIGSVKRVSAINSGMVTQASDIGAFQRTETQLVECLGGDS